MKNILVTGSTGFIGGHLLNHLHKLNVYNTFNVSRKSNYIFPNTVLIDHISGYTDWSHILNNIDVVVHCAAAAGTRSLSNSQVYETNFNGTINLVKQCIQASVKRFVFISTIKVNGESTNNRKPFLFDDDFFPFDVYGQSKADAESILQKICNDAAIEFVIIRPPLVYGPGVKGNFASLLSLTLKRLPLPLGNIKNKRSMVSVQNLVDLITSCIDHPKAANQIFLVSDDEDVSTSDLLRRLGNAANKPTRLINFPVGLIRFIAKLAGKESAVDRLTGSLQVDITHTKETLNWSPPLTLNEGLRSCFQSKDV